MKKRIISLCMVVCLLAVAIVGGTMAYFSDETDPMTNVLTVGDAEISLSEDYPTDQVLIPTPKDNVNETNYVQKDVKVTNNGNIDVYTRVIVAFEHTNGIAAKLGVAYDENAVTYKYYSTAVDNITLADGKQYSVVTFLAKNALAPNATITTLEAVRLMETVTEDNLKGVDLNNYQIHVVAQAVQADGNTAATPEAALNAAFGDVSAYTADQLNELFHLSATTNP